MASSASPPAKRRRTRSRARSALTVSAKDNQPTAEQDHDASSDSDHSWKAEFSNRAVVDHIIYRQNYTLLPSIRRIFAQRYNGVKIYVDDMNHQPQKVWIYTTREAAEARDENCVQKYDIDVNTKLKIITSEMEKKWPSPAPSYEKTPGSYDEEKHGCLQYMLGNFEAVGERITYDRKKSQWICNEDALPCSSGATEESHTSQEKKRHSDKPVNQQGNDTKIKNLASKLEVTLEKYGLLNYAISSRIIAALESQMRNSCGRDTISMLLRCACAIAFGPRYEEEKGVFVYQVGTSNYPFEGFPIASINEFELNTNDDAEDESPLMKATRPLPLELPGYQSPPTNVSRSYVTSPGSQSSDQESTRSFGKGYIYPDIIVACKSGYDAKFLLLIEVKSNENILQNKGQVLRQGVGALVGQKQVFALVVSHMRGTLLKICRNDHNAQFIFNEEQYRFQEKDGVDLVYNGEAWFMMFIDLIKVLDSAMQNVQVS